MPRGDRGGTCRGIGSRCVAANCGNTHFNGFSLHTFPRDPALRKKWTDFVKTKRVWDGPKEYSILCSAHFTRDCFPFRYLFEKEQMGLTLPGQLNKDAVPTIHASVTADPATPSTSSGQKLDMLSPKEEILSQGSPPKKLRRGYVKREAKRLISAYEQMKSSTASVVDVGSTWDETGLMEDSEVVGNTASVSCQVKPTVVSKQCQTKARKTENKRTVIKMVSKGVQTEAVKTNTRDAFQLVKPEFFDKKPRQKRCDTTAEDFPVQSYLSPMKDDPNDPNYELPSSQMSDGICSESAEEGIEETFPSVRPESERKFIVFEGNLLELFKTCRNCTNSTRGVVDYINGSLVKIRQVCTSCLFEFVWFSQPFVGNKPAGNLMISAGILFSGLIPSKTLRMYSFNKIQTIGISSFINHQRYFLHPAIEHVWNNFQENYFNDVVSQGRSIVVGGDGRADTPGHSAKFGNYTMMDLNEGIVIDIQLVQSNEVKSSAHMEKEGLVRSVEHLRRNNINIQSIVTDRHVQIVKWIRENMLETEHCFDVWHVAKGLKKKLVSLAKEKDCGELSAWIKSLVNHLYWTAASSGGEDGEVTLSKWLSVQNHIINIHSGHSALFSRCQHGDLEGRERQKRWLKPGTKVYEKLDEIINSRQMRRDVPMLSSRHQTFALEGYHSVINHFAPKMIGFSYHGMLSRLWLAALHFNENSQRNKAHTADGQPRYDIVFPKFKKGEFTVRKVPVECTYQYIDVLMETVFRMGEIAPMNKEGFQLRVQAPPPLCSQYERPAQEAAVRSLLSRFNEPQPCGSQCTDD